MRSECLYINNGNHPEVIVLLGNDVGYVWGVKYMYTFTTEVICT
jgi:hypothetical protein